MVLRGHFACCSSTNGATQVCMGMYGAIQYITRADHLHSVRVSVTVHMKKYVFVLSGRGPASESVDVTTHAQEEWRTRHDPHKIISTSGQFRFVLDVREHYRQRFAPPTDNSRLLRTLYSHKN